MIAQTTGMELLFFDATWSSAGKLLRPLVRRVAADFRLPLTLRRVDQNPKLARQYGLSCLPEILLLEGEAIVERWVGLRSEYELRRGIAAASARRDRGKISPKS